MNTAIHRAFLFEAIESKLNGLYDSTRSIRYSQEVREYTLVVLMLMNEYIDLHGRNFSTRSLYRSSTEFLNTSNRLVDFTNFSALSSLLRIEEERIRRGACYYIRKHFSYIFSQILKIHCQLEGLDYEKEYRSRYINTHGIFYILKPGKKTKKGGGRIGYSGNNGMGSKIASWGGTFRARYEYNCMNCFHIIHVGELYEKEVIRMGRHLETLRFHQQCPTDPDDGVKYEGEVDISEDILFQNVA